jgi:hypothetical protein
MYNSFFQQLKTITAQTLGSENLHFLNFFTCTEGEVPWDKDTDLKCELVYETWHLVGRWENIDDKESPFHNVAKTFIKYSLISIRQNYKFDMLATIWHDIVSWFLKISQDFPGFAQHDH